MAARVFLTLVIYCTITYVCLAHPFFKIGCTTDPVYRGRADPIVDPGKLSKHSHKVWGGNNFGIGNKNVTPIEYYNHIRASPCTNCRVSVDLTNYWVPDLFYQWPNGSLTLVPSGGLLVYYLGRGGSGDQQNPDFQPFPKGFRMVSGNPMRRSFNYSSIADRAISYACLGTPGPETPYFPTNASVCDTIRAQVWFPMCWDGVNVDSPNHMSHVSFPVSAPNGGNCPASHPVRLPGIFFEAHFSTPVAKFPHGTGTNPFVWACGDKTGYGLHGDYLNGWDVDILGAALKDPSCDAAVTGGDNIMACQTLAPYVKESNPDGACKLTSKIYSLEDQGYNHPISHLPGCNPITSGPQNAVSCVNASIPPTIADGFYRVLLRSALNDKYTTTSYGNVPLTATYDGDLSYTEVFVLMSISEGNYAIFSEHTERYVVATSGGNTPMTADRGSPGGWETFQLTKNSDGTYSILATSNSKYVSVGYDGLLRNNITTIAGPAQKFYFVEANSIEPIELAPQDVSASQATTGSLPATTGSKAATTGSQSATTGSKTATTGSKSATTGSQSATSGSEASTSGSESTPGPTPGPSDGPTQAPGETTNNNNNVGGSSASSLNIVTALFLSFAIVAAILM